MVVLAAAGGSAVGAPVGAGGGEGAIGGACTSPPVPVGAGGGEGAIGGACTSPQTGRWHGPTNHGWRGAVGIEEEEEDGRRRRGEAASIGRGGWRSRSSPALEKEEEQLERGSGGARANARRASISQLQQPGEMRVRGEGWPPAWWILNRRCLSSLSVE